MAILRYRLYEIDRIISRTLAYAIVTGLLIGVYAGLVRTLEPAHVSVWISGRVLHHVEHGGGAGARINGPFGIKIGGTGRDGGNQQVTVADLSAEDRGPAAGTAQP